ncbi:MAG: cytochrome c oxidase subunit II [Bdellovibrionales bacterium]|nr:cytochrome c oxidase subunit II [Bdellovibrionales bacterium]
MFLINRAFADSYMPPAATEIAERLDGLYGFLVISSLIASVLVIFGFIYFAWAYKRRSENDKTAYITHNNTLEFAWSFIPFVIFMVVFGWGWWIYKDMRTFSKDSLEIHVVGQKWNWNFMYKNGKETVEEMVVPVNTPVKVIITSKDVLHSFYVPAFRVKQDAVPGRYTAAGFTATKKGTFQVFCTEYCGDAHSAMLAKVRVVSVEEYEEWLKKGDPYEGMSLAEVGQKIYAQRCIACHNTSGEKKVGPGFQGLWMAKRQFAKGESVVADANYIRESIYNPQAKIVAGYENAYMTAFAGQLDDREVTGIIEFLKTLK